MGKLAHVWLAICGWILLITSWTCLPTGSLPAILVSGVAFQLFVIIARDLHRSRRVRR